ncbi:MAG: cobaltochelatase subunit CobN, partial [Psychrosphaera sp.]|nr:cobaltochelatase subunit CobN [Psychrosphaera sp.]
MHLLAAQPGGFTDDEGIIDLAQTPADIVILSAADSAIAALANSAEGLPEDFPTIRLANWMQLLKPAAFDLYQHKVLDHAKIVVVSLLGGQGYWQYGFDQLQVWADGQGKHLILVPGDDNPDQALFEASNVSGELSFNVWRYLREGGALNNQQLYYYLADQLLEKAYQWHQPKVLPSCLIYMSHLANASLNDWRERWQPDAPVCVVLFYRSHLQSANTVMFDG